MQHRQGWASSWRDLQHTHAKDRVQRPRLMDGDVSGPFHHSNSFLTMWWMGKLTKLIAAYCHSETPDTMKYPLAWVKGLCCAGAEQQGSVLIADSVPQLTESKCRAQQRKKYRKYKAQRNQRRKIARTVSTNDLSFGILSNLLVKTLYTL